MSRSGRQHPLARAYDHDGFRCGEEAVLIEGLFRVEHRTAPEERFDVGVREMDVPCGDADDQFRSFRRAVAAGAGRLLEDDLSYDPFDRGTIQRGGDAHNKCLVSSS